MPTLIIAACIVIGLIALVGIFKQSSDKAKDEKEQRKHKEENQAKVQKEWDEEVDRFVEEAIIPLPDGTIRYSSDTLRHAAEKYLWMQRQGKACPATWETKDDVLKLLSKDCEKAA